MLSSNQPFLRSIFPPLFWLTHLSIVCPGAPADISALTQKAGRIWHNLIYPMRTGGDDQRVIDRFLLCLPYFLTQAIQDGFIRLLGGHPSVMQRAFRMRLCALLVRLLSGIEPIDTLLKSRLSFYFHFPPQADLPEQQAKPEDEVFERVTLPTEDTSTLIEMCHRQRPVDVTWKVAGVSPFYAALRARATIPYTREANLIVQMPKNGEADWTTDLPPLLQPINARRETTVRNYDPSGETRSLMQRSRRPLIVMDHEREKAAFQESERERQERRKAAKEAKASAMREGRQCSGEALSGFVDRLRALQLENKRTETPALEEEKGATASANGEGAPKVQLSIDQQVVGLLEEKDLLDLDDVEEVRAYMRTFQENHPLDMHNGDKREEEKEKKKKPGSSAK